MNVVSRFLDILVNEVSASLNPINDIENKKNEILEINNIIIKYGNELNEETILNIKDDDLKRLFVLYCDKNEELYNQCLTNIQLIKTYIDFKEKFKNFESPQYESAVEWLKAFCIKIYDYINNFKLENDEYQKYLEEKSLLPKKILNFFKNDSLIKPIFNIDEVLNYIDNLNLSLEDKIDLKCEIGKMNSKLLFKNISGNELKDEKYQKYYTIIKNKKNKYKEIYKIVKKEIIEFDTFNENIHLIAKNNKLDVYDVCQSAIVVLLEKELKNKAEVDIEYLEKILDLCVCDVPKEEVKETEDEKILKQINDIFAVEKRLIEKINEDDLSLYLADSINLNDEKAINYKIVSVLTALYTETEKFKNSKGTKYTRDNALGNIRQFIEAYNLLKDSQKSILDSKRKIVLYLTNKSDKPFVMVDSKEYDNNEKNNLLELLNQIEYEDISSAKCSEVLHDLEVYKLSNEIIKVSFLKLANDAIMVLNANIVGKDNNSSFVFSNEVKFIKSIIEIANDKNKLLKLYKNQDKIRNELLESLK